MKEKIEKLIEEYSDKAAEAAECEESYRKVISRNPQEQLRTLAKETFWGTKREYYEKFVLDLRSLLAD
jgi:sugar-specific transcriptional regulator TrmB